MAQDYPLPPSPQDRTLADVLINAAADAYLLPFYNATKRPGESIGDFIVRHILPKALDWREQQLKNGISDAAEQVRQALL